MSKIIIFDFDGVLADSVEACFKMNEEAVASINKTLTLEEYLSCFQEHINKRLASLLGLSEEEKQQLVTYKAGVFPKYYNSNTVKLFDFAKELIIKTSKLGELWIVSSTPSDLIVKVLEPYGLVHYFSKIIGQNKEPKNIVMRDILEKKKDGEVFFITDTTGDIKETRKMNSKIYTLAVTWGFHDSKLLISENPDILVNNTEEILDFVVLH